MYWPEEAANAMLISLYRLIGIQFKLCSAVFTVENSESFFSLLEHPIINCSIPINKSVYLMAKSLNEIIHEQNF